MANGKSQPWYFALLFFTSVVVHMTLMNSCFGTLGVGEDPLAPHPAPPFPQWDEIMNGYLLTTGILVFPFPFVSNLIFGLVITVASILVAKYAARAGHALNRLYWYLGASTVVFEYCTDSVLRKFTWGEPALAQQFAGPDRVTRIPVSAAVETLSFPEAVVGRPLIEALARGWGFGFIVLYSLLWGFAFAFIANVLVVVVKNGVKRLGGLPSSAT